MTMPPSLSDRQKIDLLLKDADERDRRRSPSVPMYWALAPLVAWFLLLPWVSFMVGMISGGVALVIIGVIGSLPRAEFDRELSSRKIELEEAAENDVRPDTPPPVRTSQRVVRLPPLAKVSKSDPPA